MTHLEKTFDRILTKFQMDVNSELLVLYKSELFFISIERIITSLSILPKKQQIKLLNKVEEYDSNKLRFLNLLNDLAKPMLSIKV